MHDRKVSRIITPGTLIDENFMDPFVSNYVLAIHPAGVCEMDITRNESDAAQQSSMIIGLAWLDLSTGHFFTQSTTLSALPSFLARTGPREVVLDEDLKAFKNHGLFAVLADDHHLISYVDNSVVNSVREWSDMLESPVPERNVGEFGPDEVAAGSALLNTLRQDCRAQG